MIQTMKLPFRVKHTPGYIAVCDADGVEVCHMTFKQNGMWITTDEDAEAHAQQIVDALNAQPQITE